jgi:hypothetical protein
MQRNLAQGIATVDEEPAARRQCGRDTPHCAPSRFGVTALKRAHAHGNRDIMRRFARFQLEILCLPCSASRACFSAGARVRR